MSKALEDQLRREWDDAQAGLNPGETEIERTLSNIATVRAGWHRVRGEYPNSAPSDPEYGFLVLPDVPVYPQGSPERRALEDEWETKALAMHAEQRTITLDAKPAENHMTRINRAD